MANNINPGFFDFWSSLSVVPFLGGPRSGLLLPHAVEWIGGSNICGVMGPFGCDGGTGTLRYDALTEYDGTLYWTPPGGTEGTGVFVTYDYTSPHYYWVPAGGGSGGVRVFVSRPLPTADATMQLRVQALVNNQIFDDISSAQSWAGMTDYRCLYVRNIHDVDAMAVQLYLTQPISDAILSVGLDLAGVGDGITTGVAQVIATETTTPTGVVFTEAGVGTELDCGTLAAGESLAFWIKRVIAAESTTGVAVDLSAINAVITC